jgi:hypothetical protein
MLRISNIVRADVFALGRHAQRSAELTASACRLYQ